VEVDGGLHLADPVAYRRDRRKDQLLQESGYLVLRFLAEDGKELDAVLDSILRSLTSRRTATVSVNRFTLFEVDERQRNRVEGSSRQAVPPLLGVPPTDPQSDRLSPSRGISTSV